MLRPRLIDFRASGGPQALGLCATDFNSISAAVNEAQERLINDPLAPDEGWWGSWVRMAFTVSRSEPTIVTPQEVSRIILLDVCKYPVVIRNEFFEFLQFGPGFQPKNCPTSVSPGCVNLASYERETVVTFTALLSTPQIIRVYASDPNDVGRTCLIQGKDVNDATVRYVDAPTGKSGLGETVTFASPFADSVNQFSELTGIQKQKTFGEIEFKQVDPTTGVETSLVVMQPGETTAYYRKYYINGLPSNCCNVVGGALQVLAMCKLDYIPSQVDSDYLRIASVPALIDECMAVRYSRMDSPTAQQLSAQKHQSALRLLFGQLDNVLGKERVAIQRHIFGSDRLSLQPI